MHGAGVITGINTNKVANPNKVVRPPFVALCNPRRQWPPTALLARKKLAPKVITITITMRPR